MFQSQNIHGNVKYENYTSPLLVDPEEKTAHKDSLKSFKFPPIDSDQIKGNAFAVKNRVKTYQQYTEKSALSKLLL